MVTSQEYWDKIGSRQLVKDEDDNYRTPTLEERISAAFVFGAKMVLEEASRQLLAEPTESNINCPLCEGRGLTPDERDATSGELEVCPCQRNIP